MWTMNSKFGAIAVCALALSACGTTGMNSSTGVASAPPVTTTTTASNASGMGVVQSIDVVPRQQAGIGLGTVAGAAVGGLLGNQVGSGSGRTAATVAGAAGGALAGHQMEKNARGSDQVYRITVRMDDGTVQTLAQETAPQVAAGDRVRLANGTIVERFR